MRPERIPLFPLNVVLLPGAELPLHIFEPRYRAMVKNCLATKSEFGMLLSLPKGLARMGCTAEIMEVVKSHQDGSLDILTIGCAPFRVLELFTDAPLLEGRVEYVEDRKSAPDEQVPDDQKQTAPIKKELVELYETCHTLVFGDYPKNLDGAPQQRLSYLIAGTLPLELGWKQQILESRSEAERQSRPLSYLRGWAPHLQKAAAGRERAAGNGHGFN
jgi:Lon protease-like protein